MIRDLQNSQLVIGVLKKLIMSEELRRNCRLTSETHRHDCGDDQPQQGRPDQTPGRHAGAIYRPEQQRRRLVSR